MEQSKVDMFMITNQKNFESSRIPFIRQKLMELPDEKFGMVSVVELKDPGVMLLISIFLGSLGIDRFMVGDTGLGVLKLLTAGLCGVLTIIDWFTIQKRTKELNATNLLNAIY